MAASGPWVRLPAVSLAVRVPSVAVASQLARNCRWGRTPTRFHSSGDPGKIIDLDSSGFVALRRKHRAFIDKTGYIADLLCGEDPQAHRAFFARPRRFGKSLTLEIMAELLRAGTLPKDVKGWGGYKAVDVDALFKGLTVYDRLKGDDPKDAVLRRAHFVVHLGLAQVQTGTVLQASIISQLARIAVDAFGNDVSTLVRQEPSAGDALLTLLYSVPEGVPVTVLVDEYDAAIVQGVSKGCWAEADAGISALRSLLVTSKSPGVSQRISHFVVTGIARFARTALFSGANNFNDISADPLLCRAIGFARQEIADTFASELRSMEVPDENKAQDTAKGGAA